MPIKQTHVKGGVINTVHGKPLSKHPISPAKAKAQAYAVNVSEGKIPGVKPQPKKK